MSTDARFRSLTTKLQNPHYRIRNQAAAGLDRLGDPRAIPWLIDALGDFDARDEASKLNTTASVALFRFGALALEPLIAALQARPDAPHDGWRRSWTAKALGLFQDPRATRALIAQLAETDEAALEGAVEGLARIGDPQALGPLEALLEACHFPAGYLSTAVQQTIAQLREKSGTNSAAAEQFEGA